MARPSTQVLKRRIRSGIKQFSLQQLRGNEWFYFHAAIFQKIRQYGKPFLGKFKPMEFEFNHQKFIATVGSTSYESPVGVVLSWQENPVDKPKVGLQVPLGYIKLSFDHGAICIEAVQGEKGCIKPIKHFEKAVGMSWPNFLIKKIEATARRLGYKQVRFRDVESLNYYKGPDIPFDDIREYRSRHPDETKGLKNGEIFDIIRQQIRTRMKTLYTKLYTTLGYQKREGDYWVKDL
jgi:hypothetical protein